MDYTTERISDMIRQHADVVVGHDSVHPDRGSCGGVGACALMRAECDAEQKITDALEAAARKGLRLFAASGPETDTAVLAMSRCMVAEPSGRIPALDAPCSDWHHFTPDLGIGAEPRWFHVPSPS